MSTATLPDLSPRQRDILAFICRHRDEHGYPPTVRDIGQEFDIKSPNGVMCHLKALQKKGYLRRQRDMSRGITVLIEPPRDDRSRILDLANGIASIIDRLGLDDPRTPSLITGRDALFSAIDRQWGACS